MGGKALRLNIPTSPLDCQQRVRATLATADIGTYAKCRDMRFSDVIGRKAIRGIAKIAQSTNWGVDLINVCQKGSFRRSQLLTTKRHQARLRGSRIVPSYQTAISRRGLDVATPKKWP
jgi:hypothetical protein